MWQKSANQTAALCKAGGFGTSSRGRGIFDRPNRMLAVSSDSSICVSSKPMFCLVFSRSSFLDSRSSNAFFTVWSRVRFRPLLLVSSVPMLPPPLHSPVLSSPPHSNNKIERRQTESCEPKRPDSELHFELQNSLLSFFFLFLNISPMCPLSLATSCSCLVVTCTYFRKL